MSDAAKIAELEMVLRVVADALEGPRNRFGRLDPSNGPAGEALTDLCLRYQVGSCEDRVDQAQKVACAAARCIHH